MKSKKAAKMILLVFLITVVSATVFVAARTASAARDLANDAKTTAAVKAYANALLRCSSSTNAKNDMLAKDALSGKWSGDTGYNLDDDYLNALRGVDSDYRFPDCDSRKP